MQFNNRLSKMEERVAAKIPQQYQSSGDQSMADPFLYETEPLLAEGRSSSAMLDSSSFAQGNESYDALSSGQSMDQLQPTGPVSWDLMDYGPQPHALPSYDRLEEDQNAAHGQPFRPMVRTTVLA